MKKLGISIALALIASLAHALPGPSLTCFNDVSQSFPSPIAVTTVQPSQGVILYQETVGGFQYATSRACLGSMPSSIRPSLNVVPVATVDCYAPDGTDFYATLASEVYTPIAGSLSWKDLQGTVWFTSANLTCVIGPPSE